MKQCSPYLYPAILILLLFINTVKPAPQPDLGGIPHIDKFIHFFFFGLLATSLIRIPRLKKSPWGWFCSWAIVLLIALLDEFLQSFSLFRRSEFLDIVADILGSGLALFLYLKWPAYQRFLELPIRQKKPVTSSLHPLSKE